MAGEEGFEPSNAGIKIRCLNQLGDSPAEKPSRVDGTSVLRGIRIAHHANAASGCRASVLATNPCIAGGLASTAAHASASVAKGANTQPPEPVIRAYAERLRKTPERCGDVGKPRDRDRLKVIAPITLGKDFHFRRRARFVSIPVPRKSPRSARRSAARSPPPTTSAASPASDARRCRARARARRPAGTARRRPRRGRCAGVRARGRFTPHRRLSASSTLAASELPPPMPPPCGMRFVTAMSAPSGARRLLLERDGGANREIVRGRNAGQIRRAPRARRRREASA